MDEQQRKMLAMDARMDGQRVIVNRIGGSVKVSGMELVCLVNFAEIGIMSLFSELEGEAGEESRRDLEKHLDAIRETFNNDSGNGLDRLMQSTAAILRGPKFMRYLASKGKR